MGASNHVQYGFINSTDKGQDFIPAQMPANQIKTTIRPLVDYLKTLSDWVEVKTEVGGTGYMDCFEEVNPNGYGVDEYGRWFVQVNVLVDDKPGVVRVFERYTDEGTPLVGSGAGHGDEVFGGALSTKELSQFVELVTSDMKFTQSDNYSDPKTIEMP